MSDEPAQTVGLNAKVRPPIDGTALPTVSFKMVNEAVLAGLSSEALEDFKREWAAHGANSWYVVNINQAPDSERQSIQASMLVPGVVDAWELSEPRVSRNGGRAPGDLEFRNQLYMRIGAAANAGGCIEAAMKRLILGMSGTPEPKLADSEDQWKTLNKKLRKLAVALGERATDIVMLLDWGEENNIREIRNDIIHAYSWDSADVGLTRDRVYLDGTSELIQITPEQLD
ncbi:hypothetical protein [Arthrobacter citreus]|uniref:hypothetical protein n=1 Tax=Arthrobacter citreus TaxID=1670 RepID=UPI0036DABADF